VSWRRRKRGPTEDLDRELTDLRRDDGSALGALRLVRKRLRVGIEDGFQRLREHPRWSGVALRHGLDDRRDELVLQTATVDGLVVLKEYVHDESAFDPPGQDDYEYFEYELDVDGRVYELAGTATTTRRPSSAPRRSSATRTRRGSHASSSSARASGASRG
jgi:hypothetical protein